MQKSESTFSQGIPIHSDHIFDYLIIGAGSAGCHLAYYLSRENQKVALVDSGKLGSGASGAAGAFLSPAIGKGNPIQQLVNTAFDFSVRFYQDFIPEALTQKGLLRQPKDEEDRKRFLSYRPHIGYPHDFREDGVYFSAGGIIDVNPLLTKLTAAVHLHENHSIASLNYQGDLWHTDHFSAKKVILTQGANTSLIDIPYRQIRPIWGQRIEVSTDTPPPHNLHKKISISAARNSTNTVAIGATHFKTPQPEELDSSLLPTAQEMWNLENSDVLEFFCGTRPASMDYLPIVGSVIDTAKALEQFPELQRGRQIPPEELPVFPNLYQLNGLGGRGFVYGSYCAKALSDHLVHAQLIPPVIEQSRLFYRWAKRLGNEPQK